MVRWIEVARPAVVCAAIAAAAGLAGRADSGAFALAPVPLSSAGVDASRPQVALDARRDAFAVWSESRPSGTTTMAAHDKSMTESRERMDRMEGNLDRMERDLTWFAHYVKADGTPARPIEMKKPN